MSNYILLTKENVHENSISSLQTKEGVLSDGRSYVAEVWNSGAISMVTYYFSATDFEVNDTVNDGDLIECSDDTNEVMLDYLIAENKLTKADPRNYVETLMYRVEGEKIFSVTVATADMSESDATIYREAVL